MVFKDGAVFDKITGSAFKEDINNLIDAAL